MAAAMIETIKVPDLGGAEKVEVIEVMVAVGDVITAEQSLVVLESDKASMEVPSPKAGKILAIKVRVGDKVSEGNELVELEVAVGTVREPPAQKSVAPAAVGATPVVAQGGYKAAPPPDHAQPSAAGIYAGPVVRKLARELGINLGEVKATGPRGRLQKDD